MIRKISIVTIVILLLAVHGHSLGADANPDWERLVGAAKKEGKVVIGAPPGSDFRNEVQATLKKRFDLDSEFVQARGPSLMSKIVAEKQAGLVSVDAFLIGPCTGNSLLKADLFEPLAQLFHLEAIEIRPHARGECGMQRVERGETLGVLPQRPDVALAGELEKGSASLLRREGEPRRIGP